MDWTDISNVSAWEIWLEGFGWGLGFVAFCLLMKVVAWLAKPRGTMGSID